jgi:hypothetical protein
LVCARGFQKNLKKIQRTKKTNCPFVHCRLFHENCRFFNTFEMTVVSSSFDSDFFPGGPRTSSGSLILNLIFSPNQNRQLFENLNTRPTLVWRSMNQCCAVLWIYKQLLGFQVF